MTAMVRAAVLRHRDGGAVPLQLDRWRAEADDAELELLDCLEDPVLDVGCGPGRIPAALAGRGRVALGIDPAAGAVTEAHRRGAPALQRSVFRPLPGEGRWGTTLLLDGNVGIGGDPHALLCRCAALVRPDGGAVVAEVEPPGTGLCRVEARVERGHEAGPWFPWASVGADAWVRAATAAGLHDGAVRRIGDRWFGWAWRP